MAVEMTLRVHGRGRGRLARSAVHLAVSALLLGWFILCATGGARLASAQQAQDLPASQIPTRSATAAEFPHSDTLTRQWFGLGRGLEERGVHVEMVYAADWLANVSGGLKNGAEYADQLDVWAVLDSERLVGYRGGTGLVSFRGSHGHDISATRVGDAQVVSSLAVPADDLKLYEAWYEHRFLDDRLRVKAGLYDLNGEFDVNYPGLMFLNSSHGIGTDFAQSGNNGPDIHPFPGLAIRLEGRLAEGFTLRAAVLDGEPGDPDDPTGLHLDLSSDEGALLVAEGDLRTEVLGISQRCALGIWGYTARFEKFDGSGEARGNRGGYLLLESYFYDPEQEGAGGLATFLRVGTADPRYNVFHYYVGAGAVYRGLIPGRPGDELGLALAMPIVGHKAERAAAASGVDTDAAEVNLELSYAARITDWLLVQPDLQYVINPGVGYTGAAGHALVVGLRFELIF